MEDYNRNKKHLPDKHRSFVDDIWKGLAQLGWTPADLARASRLSQATISRILKGTQVNLTDNTRYKIKNALILTNPKGGVDLEKEKTIAEEFIRHLQKENAELKEAVRDLKVRVAKYEKAIGEKLNFMDESDEVLKPNGTTGDKI